MELFHIGFRRWVHELWLQNCDELFEFRMKPYDQKQYWDTYKYWLKREFKHRQRIEKINTETAIVIQPNLALVAVLDDKLDYTGAKLLSNSQNRLIKTLKDNNEKQR